ncbi:hypothetical protein LUZ60_002091 [Juncus effusus]|nr:hypothetical protein LUZ60_002091 [Juncus effusus]
MARNKEALVLLIDVSPSMHAVLPEIEKVCSLLMQKKLIYGKYDDVGVVLFGTDETENDLEKEVGGYDHVSVLRNIKIVDREAVDIVQNLKRGNSPSDFIDAIVVGLDMLIKKYGGTNKGKQRMCLITDARSPIKEPFEGTKEDQVDTIAQQMKAHGMRLESVVYREPQFARDESNVTEENDRLLSRFSKGISAKTIHVDSPTSLLGALKTRNISPVTIFRGDLEISPIFKIKVWVYKKTQEEKFPTLKKYSDKAPSSDKSASHEVKVDYEYKSVAEQDRVVPPEQRIKGYRYGPQVVPVTKEEMEAVKLRTEKGVRVLGFTDRANVPRHYFMKDVYAFIPEPGNNKAIAAVSAIARAMKEDDKCAILRCVWRQGQTSVVVGVLTPNVSSSENIPDSFYFNVLPFAEDIREFQFPSFDKMPSAWQPTVEQQEAADDFVLSMDLAPPGRAEILPPDLTPNPVLERFYRYLDLKSKEPDAEVPPLDSSLKRITEPYSELLSLQAPILDEFRKKFPLIDNPKKKKGSRTGWRGSSSTNPETEALTNQIPSNNNNNANNLKIEGSSTFESEQDEKIGDLNPVKDFEAMMAGNSAKWISIAIQKMKNYINDLLENSCDDSSYNKALDCLIALRKGCIIEQEPSEFNKFVTGLYAKWKNTDLVNFFRLLSSKGITLIMKEEAADSEVTEEEAKGFLVKIEAESQ